MSGSPTTLEIDLEPTANTEEEELAPRLEEVNLGLVKSEIYRQGAGGISGQIGALMCSSGARSGWNCRVGNVNQCW